MIDHKNHCSVVLTGQCNCQPTRTELWTERSDSGDRTYTVEVNNLTNTVICSYEYIAALLIKVGLVKSDAPT